MEEDRAKRDWRGGVGWTALVFGVIERVVGWGGSIDFVLSRTNDPGWVGKLLAFFLTNIGLALILAGVGFIVWNERRRTDRLVEARLSARHAAKHLEEPSVSLRQAEPELPSPAEEPIWLGNNITPIFLVEQHEGKTSIEADDITRKYLGHWMKVGGFIRDIFQLSGNHLMIVLSYPRTVIIAGFEMQQPVEIRATFQDDFKRLKLRRAGDYLSISGQLKSVSYGEIDLELCRLIKAMTKDEIKALSPSPPPPPDTESKTRP